ncbi:unnamed protein product [Protopolystoma xenopodis]|uniref:Uncharacterized protein n=1 Tax=Protopolystoma xenopodis TaxID=117903 RepID=A0A448X5G9_9PLAT|nr:unnamed protein product [Protopolystoma xenopodis]
MQIPYPKQNSESTICEDTRQLPLACEKIGSANPASEPGRPASPGPPEGMIRSKPRITTQEELEAAKERYLLRKEAGIHPTIQDSDE